MSAPLWGSPVVRDDLRRILAQPLPWGQLDGRTVLVTGANGMLPSYAVLSLLARNDAAAAGITVHALVRSRAAAQQVYGSYLDRPDLRLVVQDVTEPLEVDGTLDVVIHGASAARPAAHAADPVGTIRANVTGSFNLLDRCVVDGVRNFVLMSSAEVYGIQQEGVQLISETMYGGLDILNPRACYSEGKRAAETIAAAYSAQHGITAHVARFGHIYGPGMRLDDGRVQADFTANVLASSDIVLNSDGSAARTYTYVGDAIAGMFRVLLCGAGGAFNIADSAGLVTIRRLAEIFVAARPERGLALRFRTPEDQGKFSQAKGQGLDDRKLRSLGWAPEVDLAAGVERTIAHHEWVSAQV